MGWFLNEGNLFTSDQLSNESLFLILDIVLEGHKVQIPWTIPNTILLNVFLVIFLLASSVATISICCCELKNVWVSYRYWTINWIRFNFGDFVKQFLQIFQTDLGRVIIVYVRIIWFFYLCSIPCQNDFSIL